MTSRSDDKRDERGGVQTVETVLDVLNAFVGAEPTLMLKTLAERAGMHPAKVHRYLVSLSKSGHVRQDAETGLYRLGPASLLLGYAAMNAIPVIPLARPALTALHEACKCSAFLAVWSAAGPRILLQEKMAAAFAVAARVGGILPMLASSTGRTFGAWLPRALTSQLLKQELASFAKAPVRDCPATMEAVEANFNDIRRRGLARATGQLNPAVHGLSAPVLDGAGNICAVITIMGPAGQFDTTWGGGNATALVSCTRSISDALRCATKSAAAPARS